MKKIIAILCSSLFVFASESPTLEMKVGGFFVSDRDTEVRVGNNGVGVSLNIQDLFGLETTNQVFRVDGVYNINDYHHIGFSWYSLHSSSERYFNQTKDFTWRDKTITVSAGGALRTFFDTDIYKINYAYSAYKSKELELQLRAGLHVTSFGLGFSGNYNAGTGTQQGSENSKFTAPLPVFGVELSYNLTNDLKIEYKSDFFFVGLDGATGSMVDSTLSVDYSFNKYIGAGVGFNSNQMKIETKDDENFDIKASNNVQGGLVYLSVKY